MSLVQFQLVKVQEFQVHVKYNNNNNTYIYKYIIKREEKKINESKLMKRNGERYCTEVCIQEQAKK